MKASSTVPNAEDVQITIAITMPVKQWTEIESGLARKWPEWDFAALIRNAIRRRLDALTVTDEDKA